MRWGRYGLYLLLTMKRLIMHMLRGIFFATVDGRKAAYRRSVVYHRFWLYKILQMSNTRLDRNHIGLSATDVKQMVHELLDRFW